MMDVVRRAVAHTIDEVECLPRAEEKGPVRDITWGDLHKPSLILYSATIFTGLRGILYPALLLKTRLQAQQQRAAYSGLVSGFLSILRSEGIRGLYRGFSTVVAGVLPAQTLYIAVYEGLRDPRNMDAIADWILQPLSSTP